MNVNIGKAIILLLQKKHRVSLASLGTFVVQTKPAQLSSDKKQLNPPSAKVILLSDEKVDHSLIEYLTEYYFKHAVLKTSNFTLRKYSVISKNIVTNMDNFHFT